MAHDSLWFVVTRNPSDGKLVIIETGDAEDGEATEIATFPTERDAHAMAKDQPLCQAWGYEVYEWTGG